MTPKKQQFIDYLAQHRGEAETDEFIASLLCKLGGMSPTGDTRLDEIYEHCIEDKIKHQAEEFYKDFPVLSIRKQLSDDFVRMERFRRLDAFDDFAMAIFQQIECITSVLYSEARLTESIEKLIGHPAYIKQEWDNEKNEPKPATLANRGASSYSIAKLLWGKDKASEKARLTAQTHGAKDKINSSVKKD